MKRIFMPPYTPYLGPIFQYPAGLNEYDRRSFENKVAEQLIAQLPESKDIRFKWQPGADNWLPFFWKDFTQTSKYTYILKTDTSEESIFSGFKDSLQRQIRKAEKQLSIHSSDNADNAIRLLEKSLGQRSAGTPIRKKTLLAIDQAAKNHQARTILEAIDKNGQVHAAIYLVEDGDTMYYLYGGYEDQFRDSGAMSLLFWKAIQLAAGKGLTFNFEGSMIQGVERFFRSFGGQLTPVSFIYRSNSLFRIVAPI